MNPLLKNLKEQASNLVGQYFFEKELKRFTLKYIDHKFDQHISFCRITEIHYDIFYPKPNNKEKIKILTIVELIILASDIMDDLQDNDYGGNPWDDVEPSQNLNIIVGLLLICLEKIEEIETSDNTKRWIRSKIHRCTLDAINGQHVDLTNKILTESDYLKMVSLKSGALIKLACLLGTGTLDKETLQIIENYSSHLGIIAQIRNDVNDLVNGFIKSDITLKKRTLPALYYLNIQNPKFKKVKEYYLGNRPFSSLNSQEVSELIDTLLNGGAIEYCKVLEQLHLHKFKECIDSLNLDAQAKEKLLKIKI